MSASYTLFALRVAVVENLFTLELSAIEVRSGLGFINDIERRFGCSFERPEVALFKNFPQPRLPRLGAQGMNVTLRYRVSRAQIGRRGIK
jgi:hypothetical protein